MPFATRATRRSRSCATSAKTGEPVRGADVDDAARKVIEARGYGQYFTHRTGHSIDPRDLHGSGPHLDNLETREERLLVPGVGVFDRAGDLHPRQDRHADGGERLHRAGRSGRDAAEYQQGSDRRLSGDDVALRAASTARSTRARSGAWFAPLQGRQHSIRRRNRDQSFSAVRARLLFALASSPRCSQGLGAASKRQRPRARRTAATNQ